METQPREWKRSPIGRVDDGGVCFCVVEEKRLWTRQRTGAAAIGRKEGLDEETKGYVRMLKKKEHCSRIYKQGSRSHFYLKLHFLKNDPLLLFS